MVSDRVLAVVPARGGSKGLPGKNIRELSGIPLIAHSILCARLCDGIDRVVVTTDSDDIAAIALSYGADVPFLRPAELAADSTPMLPVLQHCVRETEAIFNVRYSAILLLEPTAPGRLPNDIAAAQELLNGDPSCDGAIGVSRPGFNIAWQSVAADQNGYMRNAFDQFSSRTRRQDVPEYFYINGALYLWRRDFLLSTNDWRTGRMRIVEIPRSRAIDIDSLDDFEDAEFAIASGRLSLPWCEKT